MHGDRQLSGVRRSCESADQQDRAARVELTDAHQHPKRPKAKLRPNPHKLKRNQPKCPHWCVGPIDFDECDDTLEVPPLRAMLSAESPASCALHEFEATALAERGPDRSALSAAASVTEASGAAPKAGCEVNTDELLALLYRQLRRLAGPRPDLDDIVQAAAERALKSLPHFEGRAQLSTWTHGVAYRTLLDHDRWYARFKRRYIYAEDAKPTEPCTPRDSEALLIEVERARRLYQALDQLPQTKRAVLILHDLEGLPASEVAAVVGANEATIRSRLRDGRAKLAELLARDPLFHPGACP